MIKAVLIARLSWAQVNCGGHVQHICNKCTCYRKKGKLREKCYIEVSGYDQMKVDSLCTAKLQTENFS